MKQKACIYFAIGTMSGSSLDGFDIAYCCFQKKHIEPNKWDHSIIIGETIPFPEEILEKLKIANELPTYEFFKLDADLGRWMGQQIKQFIESKNIQKIDLITSHGHTVFHAPQDGFTVQIGNVNMIASFLDKPVIGDIRSMDVALGGQGAPIVPLGDRYLYGEYSFCLNLGGIANISYTNPQTLSTLMAHDICVCNQLLNYYADGAYDKDGEQARSGSINEELLWKLNELEFHKRSAPKSLSNQFFKEEVLANFEESELSNEDKLATGVEMIATQIGKTINKVIEEVKDDEKKKNMKMLVTGGGAYNKFLIERLQEKIDSELKIVIGNDKEIQYKEAMIMGFLGVLRLRREINLIGSVSGAREDSIGGGIYQK